MKIILHQLLLFLATALASPPIQADSASVTEPVTGMQLRLIPAGCYTQGSPPDEYKRDPDEGPQRRVCLKPFLLGVHEVTQAQWQRVMGNNPARFVHPDHPVEMISWQDAQRFIAALNAHGTGDTARYRLPTEAEWEYACRAGSDTPFQHADDIDMTQANFDDRYPYRRDERAQWFRESTTPVGRYPANAFGLHDMLGNVIEWVADGYRSDAYAQPPSSPETGHRLADPEARYRVARGGSWVSFARHVRCAKRYYSARKARFSTHGLRLARDGSPVHTIYKEP